VGAYVSTGKAKPADEISEMLLSEALNRVAPGFPDGAGVVIIVYANGFLNFGGNTTRLEAIKALEAALASARKVPSTH